MEPEPARRVIMLVDMDYFFAQCEEKANPALKGKPLAVCVFSGRTPDSGVVSTCNYEARKLGVKSGIPIAFAKRVAPKAIFLPMNRGLYSAESEGVMKILSGFEGKIEVAGIDEAYLDVGEKYGNDFGRARELAEKIKAEVKAKTGLTCSIGVGPNKLVAKIASAQAKPDGLTIVKPEEVSAFLSPLGVGELVGVGKKAGEILKKNGIRTIGELSRVPLPRLEQWFGKSRAAQLHESALGKDESPLVQEWENLQYSRIGTLKEDSSDFGLIKTELDSLAGELFERLKAEGVGFKNVSIIAITTDLKTHTRSRALQKEANDLETIQANAGELLRKFMDENPEAALRRVGARVSSIIRERPQKGIAEFL